MVLKVMFITIDSTTFRRSCICAKKSFHWNYNWMRNGKMGFLRMKSFHTQISTRKNIIIISDSFECIPPFKIALLWKSIQIRSNRNEGCFQHVIIISEYFGKYYWREYDYEGTNNGFFSCRSFNDWSFLERKIFTYFREKWNVSDENIARNKNDTRFWAINAVVGNLNSVNTW